MKISKRLLKIASYVLDNSCVLDVGCDHALLDIYLVLNKNNVKAIASDVNENALKIARKNIEKYNLLDKIDVVLQDGLVNLSLDVDTLVIAGMGTKTILDILNKGNLDNIKRIIVSSNNNYYELRKGITKLGFKIVLEDMVYENNIYYPIIVFERGSIKYSKLELEYGPILLKQKSDIFLKYINFKKNNLNKILDNLDKKNLSTYHKIKKEISDLDKIN